MKIRIGPIEADVTMEEFDELVKRYGGEVPAARPHPHPPAASNNAQPSGHQDTVMLKRFVEAGTTGVEAHVVGDILGKRGKATRGGIVAWAARIGLPAGGDPYEVTRIGTKRGFRIKSSLMEVAKSIAAVMKT